MAETLATPGVSAGRHTIDLAPIYDRSNGWLEVLPPLPAPKTVTGDLASDYLVIGGGYSGLAAARRLAELKPSSTVMLVDGDRIGNNAAGRSSGFAIDHAHNLRARSFDDAKKVATEAIALNRAGLAYLDKTIAANGIDCQWSQAGKFHAAATKRGVKMLDSFAAGLEAIDEDFSLVDTEQCRHLFGTDYYRRAIHAPHSYLVQPAAMVRGLAETMPENVDVYEDSMVTEVEYGSPHVVWTANGSITTPTLILATNGFTEGFGFLRKQLIPLITWGSMTADLTDEQSDAFGGAAGYGIIAAHPAGTTVRRVGAPTNRIVIRNTFSFSKRSDFVGRKQWAAKIHRRSFERRWPRLAEVPFQYSWGGAISLSRNGQPVFGHLGPDVYASVVHNGVGIARGTISGKLLAEMIAGHNSDLGSVMAAKARPNQNLPFQDLGVRINARARRLIAGREE